MDTNRFERAAARGQLPEGAALVRNIRARQRVGRIWQRLTLACTLAGLLILLLLGATIVNDAFGAVAVQSERDLAALTGGRPLEQLGRDELLALLQANLRARVLRGLEREQPLPARDADALRAIVAAEIVKPEIVAVYPLSDWLFRRDAIAAELRAAHPRAELQFRSWLGAGFLTEPMSSRAAEAGIRTAVLGSFWMLLLTVLIAFPLGIGAALYLEEYATVAPFDARSGWGRRLNAALRRAAAVIQVNIYNLAGVPSIIYGMLGLAIFVRALEALTSGRVFGLAEAGTANGRTVLAASLTMALLVLPVVIISAQEAIRAVPASLRQASFGLGATRLQTILRVVLPNALPGILTGAILAISRAIGETAPLIVVGAATFIVSDPSGPFAKFTALPIQIYNWTSRPQDEFRALAAAAIIVLLLLLLATNLSAIMLRNRLRARRISA
jgi:phosphate transport system permease protein